MLKHIVFATTFCCIGCSCSDKNKSTEFPPENSVPTEEVEVTKEKSPISSGTSGKVIGDPVIVPEPESEPEQWAWPLKVNEGVRVDSEGLGWFGASRGTKVHSGIDIKAPMQTPVYAICSGQYQRGSQRPYGQFIKLVCKIPDKELWISSLYAHLYAPDNSGMIWTQAWSDVKVGEELWSVGKSGNADDPDIEPHLHLEIRVHTSEEEAKEDIHSLRDFGPEDQSRYEEFEKHLKECVSFDSASGTSGPRIDVRFDPVFLIGCYGELPSFTEGENSFSKYYKNYQEK